MTTDASEGTALLQSTIISHLQTDKKVLWMVPGGSNIPLSVAVMQAIPTELTKNLTVTLTDERYGSIDHPDSNWFQLYQAGWPQSEAVQIPVLYEDLSLPETTERFSDQLGQLLGDNEFIVGQYGMGSDGHIAGVLPHSPAVQATSHAASYETESYTRITSTLKTIAACNVAFLFAFGNEKRTALTNLQSDLPLIEQPAQVLKQIPECFIYNDQIGEES